MEGKIRLAYVLGGQSKIVVYDHGIYELNA